jgi:hypothetical protein
MGEMGADLATEVTMAEDRQTPLRTWAICGPMLLATMLNYIDRQTLAQQATDIRGELRLSNESYGWLDSWSRGSPAEAGRYTGCGWRHLQSVFC